MADNIFEVYGCTGDCVELSWEEVKGKLPADTDLDDAEKVFKMIDSDMSGHANKEELTAHLEANCGI